MNHISICPTYKCNLSCSFCYQKGFNKNSLLNLDILDEKLKSLCKPFTDIEIYGGEISILPDNYLIEIFDICKKYSSKISTVTNFVHINPILFDYPISTSIDFDYRPVQLIIKNIIKCYKENGKKVSLLFCKNNFCHYYKIKDLVEQDWVESFRIIPCMSTPFNDVVLNFKDTKKLIKLFYTNKKYEKPKFIQDSCFITPEGEVKSLYYINNKEYFVPYKKILPEIQCLKCDYYKKCFNEHNVITDGTDCSGFFELCKQLDEEGVL